MKKNVKRGVSLIVLVITIVVVVILAVAVILSIANNNPIENAKKAVFLSDISALKDELSLYISNKMSDPSVKFDASSFSVEADEERLKEVFPSLKEKYKGKITIKNGKLKYNVDTDDMQELNWAYEAIEGEEKNYTKLNESLVENTKLNVKLDAAKAEQLYNLRIYGNSVQNGTPTPNAPVEVESVGDKVTDESDLNYGKYKIPITVSGKNLFDIKSSQGFLSQYDGLNCTIEGDVITVKSSSQNPRSGYLTLGTFKPGTYCITANIITGEDSYAITLDNVVQGTKIKNGQEAVVTITKETQIGLYQSFQFDVLNQLSQVQIEEGTTATEYEPYYNKTYNIYLNEPLRKVGDEKDYIDLRTGEVVRKIKELELNSNMSIGKYVYRENNGIDFGIVLDLAKSRANGLCNRESKIGEFYSYNSRYLWLGAENKHIYWVGVLDDLNISTVEEFKAWLTENPTRVYYSEKNLPSESIDNLPEIFTKNGTNIISIGTQISPTQLDVIYNKQK